MRHRAARLTTLGAVVALGVVSFCLTSSTGLGSGLDPQRRAKPAAPPRVDYTRFSHRTAAHQRACDSCHKFPSANWKEVRKGDAAFPDVTEYPEHASCLGCHRQQFFARERPAPQICSVCHVGVRPRSTARRPFPNPLEAFRTSKGAAQFVSDFRVFFPHDKHLELFGEAKGGESCATCHQTYQPQTGSGDEYVTGPPKDLGDAFWLKKGTFKTWPDSHESCFTCHGADSGPVDCAMCHKLATAVSTATDFDPGRAEAMGVADPVILERWRRRASSATFPHDGGLHTEVGCTSCHDVRAMDTTDERTTKVRVQSCGGDTGCHVTATTDDGGALNFELDRRKADPTFRCEKCHLGLGAAPVPATHWDAIPKPSAAP